MGFKQICLWTVLFLVSVLAFSAFAAPKAPEALVIKIENMKFTPDTFSAKKGQKITWVNNDLVPHTVTADDKAFDSKTIDPGKTWTLHTKKIGAHKYKCSFHPIMLGSMSVE